jgi:hypothetical protein
MVRGDVDGLIRSGVRPASDARQLGWRYPAFRHMGADISSAASLVEDDPKLDRRA